MRRTLVAFSVLGGLIAAGVTIWLARRPTPVDEPAPESARPRLLWRFEAPEPGYVVGAPAASEDTIYLAVGHAIGFQQRGAVYALDPATGKSRWVYTGSGAMLHTASTPLLTRGKLFVGEGLHNNFTCRLHAIDAATGQALWNYPTTDHIEGGPALAGGLIVFPAGNDGLYAVDIETGQKRWNFRADLHIDSTPFVEGGRIYVGSGPSRRFDTLQVVCLDAGTGVPRWRAPVGLPAWGSPMVAAGRVFAGLGNGRLTLVDAAPAGGLVCLDAESGKELWTFPVPDAVFGRPVIGGERIVFGSRDGFLRGLSLEGKEAFRLDLGAPVMARATADGRIVYGVSVAGRLVCVDAVEGREVWRYELSGRGQEFRVYAGPCLMGRKLLVAGEMVAGQLGVVCLFAFELPETAGR